VFVTAIDLSTNMIAIAQEKANDVNDPRVCVFSTSVVCCLYFSSNWHIYYHHQLHKAGDGQSIAVALWTQWIISLHSLIAGWLESMWSWFSHLFIGHSRLIFQQPA